MKFEISQKITIFNGGIIKEEYNLKIDIKLYGVK